MSFTSWNLKTKTKRFFIPSWEQSTNPIQQDQVRSHEAYFLRLFWATFYDYKKEKVITFSLSLFFFRMLAAQVLWLIPMFGHWRMLKKKLAFSNHTKISFQFHFSIIWPGKGCCFFFTVLFEVFLRLMKKWWMRKKLILFYRHNLCTFY